jgi:LmbE family N-acetylglucosaminyl deacetylase
MLILLAYLPAMGLAQQNEPHKTLKGKVLLAIFAHPDDEECVSPVLAKYAHEGASVYLVVVTDGRFGVTDFAKIPPGDTLANIRTKEIRCAAEQMGINAPIQLGFHDKLNIDSGFNSETNQLNLMRKKIVQLFVDLKPDVVLTWPSAGWTGHLDHRLVGDVVTDVFAGTHWSKPVQLFFPGLPSGNKELANSPFYFAMVDSAYLTVKIELSDVDISKAFAAWACHKSQYTQDGLKYMSSHLWDLKNKVAYFRPFFSDGRKHQSLFY